MRLSEWLARAAQSSSQRSRHLVVTRSRAWRRYLLADAPPAQRMLGELIAPPAAYLRWLWPKSHSNADAWRRHMALAWRS